MAFRKVAQLKEMSFDFSSSGGTSAVQLYTDLPGNAMAARLSAKTLSNSAAGRKTETIPLDGVEASLYRPEITPGVATILRLFGGVIWMRYGG